MHFESICSLEQELNYPFKVYVNGIFYNLHINVYSIDNRYEGQSLFVLPSTQSQIKARWYSPTKLVCILMIITMEIY